ncbi:MAG: hypothetical protein M1812_005204 [Candelaria pacifica]|nr:MAG: hypothetical protein M1812_005204 [Candelaria pacifica]
MSNLNMFYSLPEELLTLIMLYMIDNDSEYLPGHRTITNRLKAIRLSSFRFAYLKLALQHLFFRNYFIATAESVKRLGQVDIGPKIGPLVDQIIFVAPLDAVGTESLLLDEGTRTIWTNTLKTLPNIGDIIFWDGIVDESGQFELAPINLSKKQLNSAPAIGDALFATSVACLADTNQRIKSLDISCHMTGKLGFNMLPGWTAFDLSHLQDLWFAPRTQSSEAQPTTSEEDNTIAERSAEAIMAILLKCKDKLESFYISRATQCPGEEVLDLPELRELMFNCGYIRPRNLEAWMARMPSIDRLQFESTLVYDDDPSSTMAIFDAVRLHPRNSRGIRVMFDILRVTDDRAISFRHFTDCHDPKAISPRHFLDGSLKILVSDKEDVDEDKKDEEFEHNLSRYLSGQVEAQSGLDATHSAHSRPWIVQEWRMTQESAEPS